MTTNHGQITAGVLCEVVGGTDGLNVGKQVRVASLRGEHSQLGRIWRCTAVDCELVTEYGAVGIAADFAQSWLLPIPPILAAPMQMRAAA